MDNFEKELKRVFEKSGNFDATRGQTSRKEIVQMWCDKNLIKAKIVFWITFLACLGMMIGGYLGLRSAGDTKGMVLWAIFIMIGFNSTILMKLWYWVENTKLNILKEMKQLQLQIAELTGKEPNSGN